MKKLFGSGKEAQADRPAKEQPVDEVECPHTALVPHWHAFADMGDPSKITSYTCDSCHRSFSFEEGERIMGQQAERLHIDEIEQVKVAAEAEDLSEEKE